MSLIRRSLRTLLGISLLVGAASVQAQNGLYQVSVGATGTAYAPAAPYADEKIPLIYVHDLNGTIQDADSKPFTDGLATDPKVAAYYTVFTFEYDTFASIDGNGSLLAQQLAKTFGSRKFAIIGNSMGGLVARAALELHAKDTEGVDLLANDLRLITLGTPHHGLPLANPAWVKIIETENPILSQFQSVIEKSTGLYLTKQGTLDMSWDDYDNITPDAAKTGKSAFLTQLNAGFPALAAQTSQKYVFYGGYSTKWPNSLVPLLFNPKDRTVQYSVAGFGVAKLIVSNDTFSGSDGIIPLSSSLYLTVPASGEYAATITNNDTNGSSTSADYQIALQADVIAAHKPAVKDIQAFKDTLHFNYTTSPEVAAKLREELKLNETLTGDLNGDSKTTVGDAIQALQFAVGVGTPTFGQLLSVNLERDGKVSIGDAIRILQISIGLL